MEKVVEDKIQHIKNWSPQDRPREKLLSKGATVLSEAELLAILIGSGTTALSAVDLAKKVLQFVNRDLNDLARHSAKDLMKIKGIGEAKAVTIVAALEAGAQRKGHESDEKKVSSSRDAYEFIRADLMDLLHEEFWVLLLNRANRIIKKKRVSEGGVSGTVADPKIIFKMALEELASSVIVVHNHPSGNLTASQNDVDLTRKLKEAGRFLEIQLLDHLIIAGQKYYSFADEGAM